MLKTPEEEQKWLSKLQKDLAKDSETEVYNRQPLYYTLISPYEQIVPDGYGDECTVYDTNAACSYTLQEFLDTMSKGELRPILEDPGSDVQLKDGIRIITDRRGFLGYINKNMKSYAKIFETETQDRIQPDTLFLTRDDADNYLSACRYNHPEGTRSYACTAVRSPRYEHLMELLHNIDWENSQIRFLETRKEE